MNRRKKAISGALLAGIISAATAFASAGIGAGVNRKIQNENEKNQILAGNEANRAEFLNNQQQANINSQNDEIETLKTNILPTLNEQTPKLKFGGRRVCKRGGKISDLSYLKKYI